jgi:hypothetical protein
MKRVPWGAIGFAATAVAMTAFGTAYYRALVAERHATRFDPTALVSRGTVVIAWQRGSPWLLGYDATGERWRVATPGPVEAFLEGTSVATTDTMAFAVDPETGKVAWSVQLPCRPTLAAARGPRLTIACDRAVIAFEQGVTRWTRQMPAPVTTLAVTERRVAVGCGPQVTTLGDHGVVERTYEVARVVPFASRTLVLVDSLAGSHERLTLETVDQPLVRRSLARDTVDVLADGTVRGTDGLDRDGKHVPLDASAHVVFAERGVIVAHVRRDGGCSTIVADLEAGRVVPVERDTCGLPLAAITDATVAIAFRGSSIVRMLDRTRGTVHPVISAPVLALGFAGTTLYAATATAGLVRLQ